MLSTQVARHRDRFFSQEVFYQRAANGTLPQFSWLHPPIEACDHPCNDIAKGERLLKDVYEALRASPKWNKTLLFVAYDDAGGYYDHVVPPFEDVLARVGTNQSVGQPEGGRDAIVRGARDNETKSPPRTNHPRRRRGVDAIPLWFPPGSTPSTYGSSASMILGFATSSCSAAHGLRSLRPPGAAAPV